MLSVEAVSQRAALESLPMLGMSTGNVVRSGRMKPDGTMTFGASDGYVGTLPSLFNGLGIHFTTLLPVESVSDVLTSQSYISQAILPPASTFATVTRDRFPPIFV
jgi:hypothetical protein